MPNSNSHQTFGDNMNQEETDPFILALQELDDKNNLYKDCHQEISNSSFIYGNNNNSSSVSTKVIEGSTRPQVISSAPKVVSLNSHGTSGVSQQPVTAATGGGKSSDLLSLINYRASSVVNNQKTNSQVFEIFKFNRGWKTKLWCIRHKQPESQNANLRHSSNGSSSSSCCNVKQKVYIWNIFVRYCCCLFSTLFL